MRVLLLCGSLRAGSTNEAVLRTVRELADSRTQTVYFEEMASLPHFNPDDDHEPLPGSVVNLRRAIGAADALLICTPEYAGDLPGTFKNLLDWTVGGVESVGKAAAWINVSTSSMAAEGTHRALRTVLTYTGCVVVDEACIHVPLPRTAITDSIVTDGGARSSIEAVLQTLRRALPEADT